jgi:hypothetical protein
MRVEANREDFIFDYRLGHVRAGSHMYGFDAIGEDGAPRVLALGGYTTTEQARNGLSWADGLYGLFRKDGVGVQILNGDTDGFSSAQELMMFIRDGILLKPRLAICLSGFYNFAYSLGFLKKRHREYADILREHPFTTPIQLEFYKEITARMGLGNDKMHYGEPNSMPAWELWLFHTDIMHCLCEEFGIRHMVFLQPCAFSGGYAADRDEEASLSAEYSLSPGELENFRAGFQSMYAGAAEGAKTRDYIVDLSGLYSSGAYSDACHIKAERSGELAEAIYRVAAPCFGEAAKNG